MISSEDIERVRAATDVVELVGETVVLRQRGSDDFWGCCPFHQEKSPSFHVRSSNGLWHCFGCGTGGDMFDYVKAREHLEFADAVRYLADRAGIELHETSRGGGGPKTARVLAVLAEAQAFYHQQLMRVPGPAQDAARRYLASRGMNSDVCRRWGLGFAPGRGELVRHLRAKGFTAAEAIAADVAVARGGASGYGGGAGAGAGASGAASAGSLNDRFYNRVMFPIANEAGKTIGFGGRVLDDSKPKYLNSRDTQVWHKSKNLFAYDRAKAQIVATGTAIIVEGYTDAIALHEAGFTNVCAVLGTALTPEHIKLLNRLKPRKIIVLLDGDAPGQAAAEKTVRFVDQTQAQMLCVTLPGGQDPQEFMAAHSKEELEAQLEAATPLVDTVVERRLAAVDLSNPGRRLAAVDEVATVLAPLAASPARSVYVARVADRLFVKEDEVERAVQAAAKKLAATERAEARRGGGAGAAARAAGAGASGATGAGAATSRHFSAGADAANGEGAAVAGEAPAPAEHEPYVRMSALTQDEARQIAIEQELLCLMAENVELVRPFQATLEGVNWCDERHLVMCWAMLATNPGTPAAAVVAEATAAEPSAASLLSAGELTLSDRPHDATTAEFLVQALALSSVKRAIVQKKSQLARAMSAQEARELYAGIEELKNTMNKLSAIVEDLEKRALVG